MKDKLTPQKSRFAKEYTIDFNGTQAAIRAGYSKKGAQVQGSRLLSKPFIQQAILDASKDRNERLDIQNDVYAQRNYDIARTKITDLLAFDEAMGGFVQKHPDNVPGYAWNAVKRHETIYLPDGRGMKVLVELWPPDSSIKNGLTMNGMLNGTAQRETEKPVFAGMQISHSGCPNCRCSHCLKDNAKGNFTDYVRQVRKDEGKAGEVSQEKAKKMLNGKPKVHKLLKA